MPQQFEGVSRSRRPQEIRKGIGLGLSFAGAFSIIALLALVFRGGEADVSEVATVWLLATGFYLVAGVVGGAIFGWLRPFHAHYWGKALTAYLILFLVYGGGTAAFWPMFAKHGGPSLLTMLGVWAVLAALLAPLYVWITKSS